MSGHFCRLPDNMTSIPCDSGTASFDPATNTVTFNNAKLTTFSSQYINKSYAAVQSKGIPLKIKGKLEISVNKMQEAYDTIRELCEMFDYDTIEMVLKSLEDYSIPADYKDKHKELLTAFRNSDWDNMARLTER